MITLLESKYCPISQCAYTTEAMLGIYPGRNHATLFMNNTKLVTTQRQNQGDLDYGLNVQGVPNGSQQLNPQRHRNKLSASLYKL